MSDVALKRSVIRSDVETSYDVDDVRRWRSAASDAFVDESVGRFSGPRWVPPWRPGLALIVCPREPGHGRVVAITVNELGQCGACRARFQGRAEGRPGFRVPAEPRERELALF